MCITHRSRQTRAGRANSDNQTGKRRQRLRLCQLCRFVARIPMWVGKAAGWIAVRQPGLLFGELARSRSAQELSQVEARRHHGSADRQSQDAADQGNLVVCQDVQQFHSSTISQNAWRRCSDAGCRSAAGGHWSIRNVRLVDFSLIRVAGRRSEHPKAGRLFQTACDRCVENRLSGKECRHAEPPASRASGQLHLT